MRGALKHILLVFISICTVSNIDAQFVSSTDLTNFSVDRLKWEVAQMNKTDMQNFFKEIEGTPYADEAYYKGKVYYRGVDGYKGYTMRLNNFLDEMELYRGDTLKIFQNKRSIEKIEYENETVFRVFPYERNGAIIYGFYRQIDSGMVSFFSRTEVAYQPQEIPDGGYKELKPARFKTQPTSYYVQINNELPKLLPQTKRKTVRFFSEYGLDINGYLEENKLKVNETGLKKLAGYLNTSSITSNK